VAKGRRKEDDYTLENFNIRRDQKEWLDENTNNMSEFVRDAIDFYIIATSSKIKRDEIRERRQRRKLLKMRSLKTKPKIVREKRKCV